MLKVTIVIGNPKSQSRTRQIAEYFAGALLRDAAAELKVIELGDHAHELFDWQSKKVAELTALVASSDIVIFASPTYKASYTGMLKAFLDRYDTNGLKGVTAIGLMTGGDRGHSTAPNAALIPLLLELGATVPMRGLFYEASQFEHMEDVTAADAAQLRSTLGRLAVFAKAIRVTA